MATITDIARQANVSRTLVSRVLNNKPGVSPENRKRILEVIEQNHYIPNGLAKSLVLRKTNTIGVVMDDLCNDFSSADCRTTGRGRSPGLQYPFLQRTKGHGCKAEICGLPHRWMYRRYHRLRQLS